MTPYQMICGSPFKMVVNLDFWHLWVFFLLVLKNFALSVERSSQQGASFRLTLIDYTSKLCVSSAT